VNPKCPSRRWQVFSRDKHPCSDIENFEDDSNISTNQQPYILVVQQQEQSLSRHSKRLTRQFKHLYDHSTRKIIEPTQCLNENNDRESVRWELRNKFNQTDILKEGYTVLSDKPFPFYSLCYMVSIERYFDFNRKS
jgi:hypothetical protein